MKSRELHADIEIEVNKNNRGTTDTYILGLNEVTTTHQLP